MPTQPDPTYVYYSIAIINNGSKTLHARLKLYDNIDQDLKLSIDFWPEPGKYEMYIITDDLKEKVHHLRLWYGTEKKMEAEPIISNAPGTFFVGTDSETSDGFNINMFTPAKENPLSQ